MEGGLLCIPEVPKKDNVEILKLGTRRGNHIVAVYVKYRKPIGTMLYSHGNAADLGQMFELIVELSNRLRLNVMGYYFSLFHLQYYYYYASFVFISFYLIVKYIRLP